MSLTDDLTKYSEEYQKQLQNLDTATLHIIMLDHDQALEYAKKGIQEVESENLSEEYIQTVTDEIQRTARMIWEERIK